MAYSRANFTSFYNLVCTCINVYNGPLLVLYVVMFLAMTIALFAYFHAYFIFPVTISIAKNL